MKRAFFNSGKDYKPYSKHISDPSFIPLAIVNDIKAQKNGTKKTVFWVKKKNKAEDGTVKGEIWKTNQQYTGDWKENKKHGYGIKIYDNKDKYEGYWENDLRNGKGTYWICLGKNKYRKLYTGDWKNNQKEGNGIFFYKDGSCYDGEWKNSKRHGKGLMTYANQDIYEGEWFEDLRHGYGVLEKSNGDKFYGNWSKDLKEGKGYYYYHSTRKIYLGEWHEDNPRCGIFTDVEDDINDNRDIKAIDDPRDVPAKLPDLRLQFPEGVLEESINRVRFIRKIKDVKNKNLQELFNSDKQQEIIKMYSQLRSSPTKIEEEKEKLMPDYSISIDDLKSIILSNCSVDLNQETLEIIFYALGIPLLPETKVDFLLFAKIYHLFDDKNQYNEEDGGDEQGEEFEPKVINSNVNNEGYGNEDNQRYENN